MNELETTIEIAPGRADDSTKEDVMRCLEMLYSAVPGEQALDRDFGINTDALGKPLSTAKALMAAEFVEKTARYEPRARVLRVEWEQKEQENGVLRPKVVVELVED